MKTAASRNGLSAGRPLRSASGARAIADTLVCLAIVVILVRTFELESYMISTGSMAPNLLGFHKRVTCPACGYVFAFGIDADETPATASGALRIESRDTQEARCPNCGRDSIDTANIPRNYGDQLLVHKNAYLFEPPHRWEIVVFRNPLRSTQAYVKRVVGLPGESIEIRNGDIFVNGTIQRKTLEVQRAMRIPVYDDGYRPKDDSDFRPHWKPDAGKSGWVTIDDGFKYEPSEPDRPAWMTYRHWMRMGGDYQTFVRFEREPTKDEQGALAASPVVYDPGTKQLSCFGALPRTACDRLIAGASNDSTFAEKIRQLYEESHVAPVTDSYGYNHWESNVSPVPVRDLMLSAEVIVGDRKGEFLIEMSDGTSDFRFAIDTQAMELRLTRDGTRMPIRTTPLPTSLIGKPVVLEMSLIDRQVSVAIDGRPAFEPWPIAEVAEKFSPTRAPVRFGARGIWARVGKLRLYRDVYYTKKGDAQPYLLGRGSYFVLGDNSPISLDSRSWGTDAVGERALLGKPLFVHLPSQPWPVELAGRKFYFRIPDTSRIRYIQ